MSLLASFLLAACLASTGVDHAVAQSGDGPNSNEQQTNSGWKVIVIILGCVVISFILFTVFCICSSKRTCCKSSRSRGSKGDEEREVRGQGSSSKVYPSRDKNPNQRRAKSMKTGASSSSLGSLAEGIVAPVGSRPKSASQSKARPNITPAPVPVEKKGQVRGTCVRCGEPVYETEERQKDEKGGYFHTSPSNCEVLARVQRGSILLDGLVPSN